MNTSSFLRASALGVLALACSAQLWAHSAIEPAPRGDGWWQERHAGFNERVLELGAKSQLIFIGDSITQGWEGAGKEVWTKRFEKYNAINLGIGGDRTQHVLWRLGNGNLKGLAPKVAVVMIGTNNSNGEDNSVEQIADGVTAIVKTLRGTLPNTQILLVSIFPRGENPNPQRGKILQVNQILQKVAADPAVHWVDFGHDFITSKGTIPRELMPDFLHLSPKAYEVWADAIQPYLTKLIDQAPMAAKWGGQWTLTLPGPDGEVDVLMELKPRDAGLAGRVARGPGDWIDFEDGRADGDALSWVVRRKRDDGTVMTYRMKGRFEGDRIQGSATTVFQGSEVSIDWSARRAN